MALFGKYLVDKRSVKGCGVHIYLYYVTQRRN